MTKDLLATLVKSTMLRTKIARHRRPAPSIFFYPGLESKPIWTEHFQNHHSEMLKTLEKSFDVILEEYLSLRKGDIGPGSDYADEEKNHLHTGEWDWQSYVLKGKKQQMFATKCPNTVSILDSMKMPEIATDFPLGFAFFSTMGAGSKIQPHYGPCNIRIRVHFPLIVPEGDVGIEVGGEKLKWEVGKPLIFDDTYEHCVWNNTKGNRVILLFDLWHPGLDEDEIIAIKDMFGYAERQGWSK